MIPAKIVCKIIKDESKQKSLTIPIKYYTSWEVIWFKLVQKVDKSCNSKGNTSIYKVVLDKW